MGTREFFDIKATDGSWRSLYDNDGGKTDPDKYNFVTRRAEVVRLAKPARKVQRVLDVGCGTGDYAGCLAAEVSAYHGVDFSVEMIRRARKGVEMLSARNTFVVASGDRIPYCDNSFDMVLAVGYIEYFDDPSNAIEEIRRVLKPQAVLIMQSYKRDLFWRVSGLLTDPARRLYRRFFKANACRLQVDRPYSRDQLDALLGRFDFERVDYAYNNFRVFPWCLRRWFPNAYITISDAITRSAPQSWGVFAVNYIGKYVLSGK